MQHVPGCERYLVNVPATEPDAVWVTEIWSSASAHLESLTHDEVKALIKKNRPLIAGMPLIVGGKREIVLPTD